MNQPTEQITFEHFQKMEMRVGTIVHVERNEKARVPAYTLEIDFGERGRKTSSAQLTQNYSPPDLLGRQVVAVMNFPVKRIAGVKSEVLVLGAVSDQEGTVLLAPSMAVENGARVL